MISGNKVFSRSVSLTASMKTVAAALGMPHIIFTGLMEVPTTNTAATITMLGDDGSTNVPLDKGIAMQLTGVDIALFSFSSTTPGDKVVFIGNMLNKGSADVL